MGVTGFQTCALPIPAFGAGFLTSPAATTGLSPLFELTVVTAPAPAPATRIAAAAAAFDQPATIGSDIVAIGPAQLAATASALRPLNRNGKGRKAATLAATTSRTGRASTAASSPARRASRRQGWQCAM